MPLAILSTVLASYWHATSNLGHAPPSEHGQPHWQTIVSNKRAELAAKIPEEWLLPTSVIDESKSRRSLADGFLDDLLDQRSRDITTREPTDIVHDIASGALSAVEVVTAFSKRASYIHQIVSRYESCSTIKTNNRAHRVPHFSRLGLTWPWSEPRSSTNTSKSMARRSGRFTVFLLPSRTIFT